MNRNSPSGTVAVSILLREDIFVCLDARDFPANMREGRSFRESDNANCTCFCPGTDAASELHQNRPPFRESSFRSNEFLYHSRDLNFASLLRGRSPARREAVVEERLQKRRGNSCERI